MLTFDPHNSSLALDGVLIAPGVREEVLASAFGVTPTAMPGNEAWHFVERKGHAINFFTTFFERLVHSGYFWVDVPSGGWDDYEHTEQQRRVAHEQIMATLFGAQVFEDGILRVELVRDPRSGLEQIAFQIK